MSRIGVYICDCMGLVSDHVDTASLEQLATELEGVTLVRRVGMLCGASELGDLTDELQDNRISHLLFAGCSPRMSLKLPEQRLTAAAARGGVDPALVEVANTREQCAWIHRGNRHQADAKARDLLRMAHARLRASAPSLRPVELDQHVLVVGGGPAGLAAARDLATAGIRTVIVEREPFVGGAMCQLQVMFQTESWPATCEHACIYPVHAQEALLNPLVKLHTSARVDQIEKRDGNFHATIVCEPRHVDPDRCIACGKCTEACPTTVAGGYKAIDRPVRRTVPECNVLLREACPPECEACVEPCPTGAIDLSAQPTRVDCTAGAVVLATGARQRDPELAPVQNGKRHPDVVTALQFERIVVEGLKRPSDGEPIEHVVFVQCAGSRAGADSARDGVPYCSKTCCAVTAKQAKRIATTSPETEVSVVYYRDFRTYERALEKLHQDLRIMGIPFLNGEVNEIAHVDDGLSVKLELLGTEELEDDPTEATVECDLVVLACAQEPELPAHTEEALGVTLDAFGYPIETQPRMLRPTETFVDRVYAVGTAAGPKAIQQSIEQGATAALRAIDAISVGARQPFKHACEVDQDRCSGCGVCLSVCPHGAIRLEDQGAVSDPAFCQGCGMCAASCPSHAAELRGFSDELLLREARAAFTEAPEDEPRILALLCYWCSYGGADLAGWDRLDAPECFRTIRIRCSSSVNTGLLMEMFRMGVDGILVAGCPHNSCHHMWGNWLAAKRVSLARGLMQQMGIDERRLVFDNIGLMHAQKFVEVMERMRDQLRKLGPNPWRQPTGQDLVVEGAKASWLAK